MIYLLHGEDDLSRREALKALLPPPGSDDELAVSTFEGAADVQAVVEACNALPFLSERRYVHLRNFIAANTRRGKAAADEEEPAPEEQDQTPAGKRRSSSCATTCRACPRRRC